MWSIRGKKYLFVISIAIIVLNVLIELIVIRGLGLNWYHPQFISLRIIRDFCFGLILTLVFQDGFFVTNIEDEIKLQKTYRTIQRFIFAITLLLCFLEAVRSELFTPSKVALGTNILIAGAVAQYGNIILRKQSSILKKTVLTCCLLLGMGVFLFGFFYEWMQVIYYSCKA